MNRNKQLLMLRLLLAGAGFGWAISLIGIFMPWPIAVKWLQDLGGAGVIPDDKMANYWLRMAAGAFTFIGVLFLICSWKPANHATLIPILGVLSLVQGIVLLVYGLILRLSAMPFAADVAICIVPGVGILFLRKSVSQDYVK